MKKLLFAVVAMVAMTMVSCGNQTGCDANCADSADTAMTDTVDTITVDSTVCVD